MDEVINAGDVCEHTGFKGMYVRVEKHIVERLEKKGIDVDVWNVNVLDWGLFEHDVGASRKIRVSSFFLKKSQLSMAVFQNKYIE